MRAMRRMRTARRRSPSSRSRSHEALTVTESRGAGHVAARLRITAKANPARLIPSVVDRTRLSRSPRATMVLPTAKWRTSRGGPLRVAQ